MADGPDILLTTGPFKFLLFQPLGPKAETVMIPIEDLDDRIETITKSKKVT